ncbi:MAG: methionyl-tRNA formyltransferase [Bacilli bacterium]|nr:methionyl-tRNA formyltransferase [Bacilli bacterium]
MKIVFIGTMQFARIVLERLHGKYPVSLVVTQPDRPYGRKQDLKSSEVKNLALELGIPVFQPEKISKDYQTIINIEPDLIIVAAYGQMIPQVILDLPKYRPINVHASLLPVYRGGAPMQRAIMNGDQTTGVTIMNMEMKMDSGPILRQVEVPIYSDDDVSTLETRLGKVGAELLVDTLPLVLDGMIDPLEQDLSKVTFAYNLKPEEERLNFHQSAKQIRDHVRAFHPSPLTYSVIDGKILKILDVEIVSSSEYTQRADGEIVHVDKNNVYVKTADDLIALQRVQLQGKNPLPIKDFLNGSGRKLMIVGKIFE